VIGGVCYAPHSTNPANGCQICDALTPGAWSANVGATCDDGLFCTVGETCASDASCGSGSARSCDDGVACDGSESCNEGSDRCDAGSPTCGAGEICNTSIDACELSCGGGTELCSGMCVNTAYDPANCGACGTPCDVADHTTPVCASSSCRYLCDGGFADCDPAATDCETDVRSDQANCGSCGHACASDRVCSGGVCVPPPRYTAVATSSAWVDACAATGHATYLAGSDDGSVTISLPFDFYAWGAPYSTGTSMELSANGYLVLPNSFNGAFIQAHIGDNYNRSPGQCTVVVGTAPNRRFVMEWSDSYYYPPGSYTGSHVTYELVLNESDYSIEVLFNSVTNARSQSTSISNQATGDQVSGCPSGAGSCVPTTGYSVRFQPSL
jgi:hypothetical protein